MDRSPMAADEYDTGKIGAGTSGFAFPPELRRLPRKLPLRREFEFVRSPTSRLHMWDIRPVYHCSPRRRRLDFNDGLCIRPCASLANKPYLSTVPKTLLCPLPLLDTIPNITILPSNQPPLPSSRASRSRPSLHDKSKTHPNGKHDQSIRVNPERHCFPSSRRPSVASHDPRRVISFTRR
ncbi:hypothetical protein BDM02DRAFT_820853 [Thelephora ganbajun]|uniref:Uncharacterized protein n=1 Tax=Thelephora ganbajun TaxID=370292 RepID=A0ACB6Z5Y6_THEGA|nr:hypothetical protein BDM02DRAFT_820853 [Thelephora ganbajun]